jgi:outer membrane protein, multidrug efflux system
VITSLKDVESALAAYFEQQERKGSLEQKVQAERRTLEIMEGLHRVGLVSRMLVLEAHKTLIDSESELVESEQSLSGDLVAIYKAIGGNWTVSLTESAEEQSGDRKRAGRYEGHGPYVGERHIGG